MDLPFQWFKRASGYDDKRGALVGYDKRHEPIYLPPSSMRGHTLILGEAGTGKTTLLSHLATWAMRKDSTLVVLDVDGDLLPNLVGQVPVDRVKDAHFMDFGSLDPVPGWNVLEQGKGDEDYEVVANLVDTAESLCHDDWGPRVEDTFRMALWTLLSANQILARKNEPQFTVVDIPYLFHLPTFRRRLLNTHVSNPEIQNWWLNYFEAMPAAMQSIFQDSLLPLLSPLTMGEHARYVLGQSHSTFDLRALLKPGNIVLVNLWNASLDAKLGHWIGALFADRINKIALGDTRRIPKAERLAPVTIAINGTQTIPLADYPGYLSELQERGVRYMLTRRTLGDPTTRQASESAAILASKPNLFVFRTNPVDAEIIVKELNDAPLSLTITRSPDHENVVETRTDGEESPTKKILSRFRHLRAMVQFLRRQ